MDETAEHKRARRLIDFDVKDEAIEAATGVSLTDIIGLRAERASRAPKVEKPPRKRLDSKERPLKQTTKSFVGPG